FTQRRKAREALVTFAPLRALREFTFLLVKADRSRIAAKQERYKQTIPDNSITVKTMAQWGDDYSQPTSLALR
ncbi:MAG: hypothetical protein KDE31_02270, partial [Caldilineaceae bacterium]|nr:hypothetical protein [Caldilineaceae bacterium]